MDFPLRRVLTIRKFEADSGVAVGDSEGQRKSAEASDVPRQSPLPLIDRSAAFEYCGRETTRPVSVALFGRFPLSSL